MWYVAVVIAVKAAVISEYALPNQYVNLGACAEVAERYAATWQAAEEGVEIGFTCKKLPIAANYSSYVRAD